MEGALPWDESIGKGNVQINSVEPIMHLVARRLGGSKLDLFSNLPLIPIGFERG